MCLSKYLAYVIVAGWPCGSVAQLARVLAQSARGPGFESRLGHVLCQLCRLLGINFIDAYDVYQ